MSTTKTQDRVKSIVENGDFKQDELIGALQKLKSELSVVEKQTLNTLYLFIEDTDLTMEEFYLANRVNKA